MWSCLYLLDCLQLIVAPTIIRAAQQADRGFSDLQAGYSTLVAPSNTRCLC